MSALPEAPAYTLRPAAQADFPAIRALIAAVRINPMGLAWQNFLLAVDTEEKMIGCGQVKTHADGSRELASIAVRPEWRGQGIAAAIIRRLLREHPGRLYLTCRSSLGPFYARFGFYSAPVEGLPPYFRRLRRLSGVLQALRLAPAEGLLIMVREA